MFGDIRISSIFPNIALENFAQIGSSKRVHAADYVESGVPFYRSKEIIELGNGQEPSVQNGIPGTFQVGIDVKFSCFCFCNRVFNL